MRYNTLNPVGADGSSDPRDLSDNAGGFDLAMAGSNPSWTDRLGLPRLSWAGFERRVNDYLAAQGFEPTPLQYVDGVQLVVQRPTQLVQRGTDLYSVKLPASFPATLSGTWATDQGVLVSQVDRSLRQQLASTASPYDGVAMLGRAAMIVNSVAELRLTPGRSAGDRAYLRGYIAGDGKGPRYLTWVPGAQQDDGGMKFAATGGTWLSDLNADGRVDAKFYGLPLASGFCTAQDAAIEAYCLANGVSAWYGPGVYDFGNDNWAWSGPRVAGSAFKDYGGISIFTTPLARFQTTSANGADVMQCCGIKNFSVQGKPRVTGTLTASSPTHGTNGVSLVYGAENVWFDLDCRDLPGLRKADGSIDGGQAFTIQPGTGNTNNYKNVRLTGNAINCNVGFGLDVNLDDVVALPISGVQIDIYAEECYRGFAIGGAAPTTSPSLNPLMGVSGSMEIVNCQQSVVCHRGVGADVSFNVMTNKPKASLVKHPFNTAVVVTSLKAAKACKFSVVGRVFSVDTMLEIGGIAMGGGVTADTKFLTLLHKVTSSGSAKEVDVIDFGGGSVSDSVIELHNVTTGFTKLVESGNIVTVNGHQAPFYFFPGDASISLPAAPLATAVYNVPLTAVRTVSLPSNPLVGHRLRVERKSTATGGGVNFAAAGNLAVGTFAELVYNGSAWVVSASGAA